MSSNVFVSSESRVNSGQARNRKPPQSFYALFAPFSVLEFWRMNLSAL
jgi:hypothetical protein